MPDNIINIISDAGNLAIFLALFLAFVLCVVALLLYSGREYKVLGHVVIPGNDRVNLKKLPHSFQKEMIADLRTIYDQRVKDISNLNYEESLNWENDFLQRVRALYEGANSVFAVTLSSISDFWVSDSDKELIRAYLECQRDKEIHRLFVFKNPYDLKKYEEILRENFKAYGNKGGRLYYFHRVLRRRNPA